MDFQNTVIGIHIQIGSETWIKALGESGIKDSLEALILVRPKMAIKEDKETLKSFGMEHVYIKNELH